VHLEALFAADEGEVGVAAALVEPEYTSVSKPCSVEQRSLGLLFKARRQRGLEFVHGYGRNMS
jgi:hypothetical protein